MKTERRHELQTNDLSQWINHTADRLKPHAFAVGVVALGLLGVFAIWQIWQGTQTSRRQTSWTEFLRSQDDPDALETLSKTYESQSAGAWSGLLAADAYLRQAQMKVYTDRDQAKSLLEQAIPGFEQAMKFAGASSERQLLRLRALHGLAQANETLYAITNDSERLDQAKENYRRLASDAGDDPLGQAAKDRLASLNSAETQKFYAWFAKTMTTSDEKEGPASPFDLRTLPGAPDAPRPDLTAPDLPEPTATEDKTSASEKSAASEEKSGEARPDEAKPEGTKPAEPKTDEKPEGGNK